MKTQAERRKERDDAERDSVEWKDIMVNEISKERRYGYRDRTSGWSCIRGNANDKKIVQDGNHTNRDFVSS